MKRYRLFFITLLMSSLLIKSSDNLIDLENFDAQFFEQSVTANSQEELTHILFEDEDYGLPLPEEGYVYLMKKIEYLDPSAYENLKACEKKLGFPCLRKNINPRAKCKKIPACDETYGYPIIVFSSSFRPWEGNYPQEENEHINTVVYNYKPIACITPQEQLHFLEIIKFLSPELYEKIRAVDPTGKNHIKRFWVSLGYGTAAEVDASVEDGLPLIFVGAALVHEPLAIQQWIIGHELGHYVLNHIKEYQEHTTYDVHMNPRQTEYDDSDETDNSNEEECPFSKTLELAFSRFQEEEADRFSIINLGAPFEGGIAYLNRNHTVKKKTFNRTHPLSSARIKHLESLRTEVELKKARGENLPKIHWDAIIEQYKKDSDEDQDTL